MCKLSSSCQKSDSCLMLISYALSYSVYKAPTIRDLIYVVLVCVSPLEARQLIYARACEGPIEKEISF